MGDQHLKFAFVDLPLKVLQKEEFNLLDSEIIPLNIFWHKICAHQTKVCS